MTTHDIQLNRKLECFSCRTCNPIFTKRFWGKLTLAFDISFFYIINLQTAAVGKSGKKGESTSSLIHELTSLSLDHLKYTLLSLLYLQEERIKWVH